MSKKCYRFFGGLLNAQDKMVKQKCTEKGYRLVRTGRMLYEFEKCNPDEVTYCVEFIGEKSKDNATDYANFFGGYGLQGIFQEYQSKLFCRKTSIASMGRNGRSYCNKHYNI